MLERVSKEEQEEEYKWSDDEEEEEEGGKSEENEGRSDESTEVKSCEEHTDNTVTPEEVVRALEKKKSRLFC